MPRLGILLLEINVDSGQFTHLHLRERNERGIGDPQEIAEIIPGQIPGIEPLDHHIPVRQLPVQFLPIGSDILRLPAQFLHPHDPGGLPLLNETGRKCHDQSQAGHGQADRARGDEASTRKTSRAADSGSEPAPVGYEDAVPTADRRETSDSRTTPREITNREKGAKA